MSSDDVLKTATVPRVPLSHPQAVRLLVSEGPNRGQDVVLKGGTLLIGTSPECDLPLSDPTVSRRHATVELLGFRIRITDLNSKNGTRYLGANISQVELPIGAMFELGQSSISVLPPLLPPGKMSESNELEGLQGRSFAMRRLFAEMEQVASSEAPVLIVGETGVGKEGVAKAIHKLSPRGAGSFQIFDCATIQPDLLQSTLFGHIRGAFTGAVQDSEGAIARADGGTLFLDEIADLPLQLQPVLLRALETKSFTRTGEGVVRKSDFRIVSATQHDLQAAVDKHRFRADLYYRLSAITLRVPPLRERPEDIPLLVEHFTRQLGSDFRLAPGTLASLCAYRWPGNARELRNAVEQMTTLGPDSFMKQGEPGQDKDFHQSREIALDVFEKSYLESLLEQCHGSVSGAARKAGMARSYFYELLAKHGLGRGKKR